jgi:hypothetical protein
MHLAGCSLQEIAVIQNKGRYDPKPVSIGSFRLFSGLMPLRWLSF